MKRLHRTDFIIIATVIIMVLFIANSLTNTSETINTRQATQQWNTFTQAQKEAWLNNYIQNPDEDGVRLISKMEKAIKSQLNFPPVVNFDHSPKFNIARVVEAGSGLIDIENTGTLKSSSGISETFSYLCKLRITSAKKELVDVLVDVHD